MDFIVMDTKSIGSVASVIQLTPDLASPGTYTVLSPDQRASIYFGI